MDRINTDQARNALRFFGSERMNQLHCQMMVRYHGEIPVVQDEEEYFQYGNQFDATVERARRSDSAYIWFHALALRMLEYELDQRFEGIVMQILMPPDDLETHSVQNVRAS